MSLRSLPAGRSWFLALLLLPLAAQAQPLPIAEFVITKVYALENSGVATVEVSITGGPLSWTSLQLVTVEDTADLDDYVDTAGPVSWQFQEAGTKSFSVEIRKDVVVEPDERFFIDLVDISDYIDLGARTRVEVIILNDDGPLRPLFVVPQPFGLTADGRGVFLSEATDPLGVTVQIGAPAPAGFFASYRVDDGPVLQLPFEEGTTQAVLTIDAPGDLGPDVTWSHSSVQLVDAPFAKADPGVVSFESIWGPAFFQNVLCIACLVQSISYGITGREECPDDCNEAVQCKIQSHFALPSTVVALRAYRDNVLSTTAAGQFYVSLYDQLSGRIAATMFEKPALFFGFQAARGEWIPGFQALADGAGADYFVTPNMQDHLVEILDILETSSKPLLVQAVQRERGRLMLDSIEGLSMNQLQQRLETLGGEVLAEPRSWGSVKARFGEH